MGAWHKFRPADWSSVLMWLWRWLYYAMKIYYVKETRLQLAWPRHWIEIQLSASCWNLWNSETIITSVRNRILAVKTVARRCTDWAIPAPNDVERKEQITEILILRNFAVCYFLLRADILLSTLFPEAADFLFVFLALCRRTIVRNYQCFGETLCSNFVSEEGGSRFFRNSDCMVPYSRGLL
jgi:hypothetical protein